MNVPTCIVNHQAVVDLYGYWPSFHDANVKDYVPSTSDGGTIFLSLHTWEMTSELDARRYFVLRKHTLITFRFDGIQDADMDSFCSKNILFGMEILPDDAGSLFRVVLDSVMDMSGSFSARRGEIVSVVPCTPDGKTAS